MAERDVSNLKERFEVHLFLRQKQVLEKTKLANLIDNGDFDNFIENYRANNRIQNKLVMLYGLGNNASGCQIQSLWLKLIELNKPQWIENLHKLGFIYGLNPNMPCLVDNEPIMALNYAIRKQHVDIVTCILKLQGFRAEDTSAGLDLLPPFIECIKNWNSRVADALYNYDICLNLADKNGNTSLHYAVKRKNMEGIDYLISKKVNVNCQNLKGKTPLHYATIQRCVEIVGKLINAGALLFKDTFNRSPLEYSLHEDRNSCTFEFPNILRPEKLNKPNKITSLILKNYSLPISYIVSMFSVKQVPLMESTKYSHFLEISLAAQVKHGVKQLLFSEYVKYPEVKNVSQIVRVDENPILQLIHSILTWSSPLRAKLPSASIKSKLRLYIQILLNSSILDSFNRRQLRTLLSLCFCVFNQSYGPQPSGVDKLQYLKTKIHNIHTEFSSLIILTQHLDTPFKPKSITMLEGYVKRIILPALKEITGFYFYNEMLFEHEILAIPMTLFLYHWWVISQFPVTHYYKTFYTIKSYLDTFYPYFLARHDILTAAFTVTTHNSPKTSALFNHVFEIKEGSNEERKWEEIQGLAMKQYLYFSVQPIDMVDFLVDMQIDINYRSPNSGDTGLHVAARDGFLIEMLHLLDIGAYPLTFDSQGNTFYQYAHDHPNSFTEEEHRKILSHSVIEGLVPPKLETLCALFIVKYDSLRNYVFSHLKETRYSKLINLHLSYNPSDEF